MPLCTQIIRDGEEVSPTGKGWNGTDLSAMYTVAIAEALPDTQLDSGITIKEALDKGGIVDFSWTPIYYLDLDVPLVREGKQVLKNDYTLEDGEETLVFKKGDILKAWRKMK